MQVSMKTLTSRFIESQGAKTLAGACECAAAKYLLADGASNGTSDLYAIAQSLDIEIVSDPSLRYEGQIDRGSSGRATIRLKPHASERRMRFTLAHELGHWILQEEIEGLSRTSKDRLFQGLSETSVQVQEEERLANLVAAELLMPRFVVLACFEQQQSAMKSLTQLCRQYQVSRVAAIRRMADVLETDILFVELIPRRFFNLDTPAEVDDAVLARAGSATLYSRERTRLMENVQFSTLSRSNCVYLKFATLDGVCDGKFDIDIAYEPVPHAYCMMLLEQGWNG